MQFSMTLLAAQNDGGLSMLLMLVVMFAIMWFFMIRPQQKQQKKIKEFRQGIERGTEIVTAGGIYGVVREIDDVNNVLIVEIANGVRIRVDRNSVFGSAQGTENYQK